MNIRDGERGVALSLSSCCRAMSLVDGMGTIELKSTYNLGIGEPVLQ